MPSFLKISNTRYLLLDASNYRNVFTVNGTSLLIVRSALAETHKIPSNCPAGPGDTLFSFSMPGEEAAFGDFFTQFTSNTLFWYRGFTCSHFSYPGMLNGLLASEGIADIPTFTMGNSDDTKTRWLPGCFERDVAKGVMMSGTDQLTLKLGLNEDVPLGVTVKMAVGVNVGWPICWLNQGEQVVRGPLGSAQFQISDMLWIKHGTFEFTKCTLRHDQLPPARPFEPTQLELGNWWQVCKPWVEQHYAVVRGLTLTKLDLSGLAPPTYGVDRV